MGRKHFTDEQIAFALRPHDGGTAVAEVIRKLGISEQTFNRWRNQYGAMKAEQAKRVEDENKRLKWLLAEAELDEARNY